MFILVSSIALIKKHKACLELPSHIQNIHFVYVDRGFHAV